MVGLILDINGLICAMSGRRLSPRGKDLTCGKMRLAKTPIRRRTSKSNQNREGNGQHCKPVTQAPEEDRKVKIVKRHLAVASSEDSNDHGQSPQHRDGEETELRRDAP